MKKYYLINNEVYPVYTATQGIGIFLDSPFTPWSVEEYLKKFPAIWKQTRGIIVPKSAVADAISLWNYMIQQKIVRIATPTEIKKLNNEVKPKVTRKTTSKKKISGTKNEYSTLINLVKNAENPRNLPIYYNSDRGVVNVGGVGYDKASLVKIFNSKPGTYIEIKNTFYKANQNAEQTAKDINSLNKGIKAEVGYGYGNEPFVKYIKENKGVSGTSSIESKVSKLKGKYISVYMLGRKEPLSNIIQSATLSSPNYTIRTLTINTNTGTERIDKIDRIEKFLKGDKVMMKSSTGVEYAVSLLGNKKSITGVYDPNIFKVVFLAGGPGSGKSAVAKALFGIKGNFSYTGLKTVNSDRFFEYLLKKEGIPSDFRNMPKALFEKITEGEGSIRQRSKNLNVAQYETWLKGRLGLIIDGTGDNALKLISQAKFLKSTYGYDALMVFVNTTLNKAIERNNKRERKLPEKLVRDIWSGSQQSLKKYKTYFGKVANTTFVEIDNSKDVPKIEVDKKIEKIVSAFLRKTPSSPKAKAWIKSELSKKSKGISGSLYQKFQEVAKKTKFDLRGASLSAFLKWMNANSKELFGKSIATKKWFTLLDEYPQIMDVMASAQIDTEPLEDEDENKVESYYAKSKK